MNTNLQSARSIALKDLTSFANSNNFWQDFELAFGSNYDKKIALDIKNSLANNTFTLPEIVIVDRQILGTANGAYAIQNNTIYLSSDFLANNDNQRIAATIIEEIGHAIDARINTKDSAGDEGEVFSALVRGETLTPAQLAKLKAENDHALITIDGQSLEIEKQDFPGTSGDNTLTGTTGDDRFFPGTGSDTINGNAGNDYLEINNSTNTADTIITYNTTTNSGGITGGSNNGTTFSSIEKVSFTTGSGNDTIAGGNGNDTLNGGSGTNSLNGGGGDDTLINGFGSANDGSSVTGGSGTDTLILDYTNLNYYSSGIYTDTANNSIRSLFLNETFLSYTGIEKFQITGTAFDDDIAGKTGDILDGGAGIDRLSLNLADATTTVNFNLTQAVNNPFGTTSIKNFETIKNITTGSGNDALTLGGGAYAFHDNSSNVAGGLGTDTLILDYTNLNYYSSGIYTDTANNSIRSLFLNETFLSYTGIEKFQITGTAFDDDIAGKTGDILDGGAGIDRLSLNLADATTTVNFNLTQAVNNPFGTTSIKNFETIKNITTGSGNDTLTLGGGAYAFHDNSSNVAGGLGTDTLILDYTNLNYYSSGIYTDTANNSIRSLFLNETFLSYTGIEKFQITGTAFNDNIAGNTGDDILKGGAGDDTLDGGLGADTFVFGEVGVTTVASIGVDTISNFVANTDKIKLHKSTFAAITTAAGTSIGTNFISVADDTLVGSQTAAIIYSRASGGLFYNADGATAGSGNNGGKFAILPLNLTLTANDFLVVDNKINLSVAPASVTEDGTPNLVYTFTRTDITNTDLTVNFTLSGTATINNDYIQTGATSLTGANGTVTFAAGATTATVIINPTADNEFEADETVALTLATGTGYAVGTTTAVTGTIINDDNLITLAAAPASVNEDGITNLVYTFTRQGSTTSALTVNYSVGGTATLGTDYAQTGAATFTATTGTVNFAAGASTATVTIDPTTDNIVEADETIALTLTSGTGYGIGTTTAITRTIVNDDANVTLAVTPATVNEDGTTNLVYTFTRAGSTTGALTVNYGVSGTATLATDYTQTGAASFTATTGTVTFAAGATTATVTVDPTTDTIFEADETVALTLASGAGYSVVTTAAVTGTIVNDDTNVTLAVAPATVNEDGTTNLVYTFTRVGATTNALTVNYGVGGTATLSTDYTQTGAASFTATTGTVTFAAGATTATVTVDPTVDITVEADETVALTLTTGTGYNIGTTTAVTGTIINDDTNVTLAVTPLTVAEDGTTNLVYTFTRAGLTTNALTVNYGVGGTATLATDYTQTGAATFTATTGTVTFAAGVTTATVTVNPTADTVFEANETVALTLATGTGYSVGTATAITGTITNDDIPPAISIADLIIVEGINGNPTQSLITISLNQASSQAISVNYATSDGTAIAGTDYTATTGTLTFAAGQTSRTISVPILNDNLNEVNETFKINLTTPTNATIADNQATITITDTITTSVTTILPALVENLTLTGTTAINGTGNAGANVITGNSANNILAGLDGNDSYIYDADLAQGADTINETSTGGIDTLNLSLTAAAININLGLTTAQTVNANLQLVIPVIAIENFFGGAGNDRITGNILANSLQGGSGDDRISGAGGNDTIFGQDGNDIISGGAGNDILFGQSGNDTISGDAGNDIFYYNGLLSGTATASTLFGLDTISDFTSTQDKITLSKATFGAITSAAGAAIGSNFITVDDDTQVATQTASIVYSLNSGGLFYNQNGATAGLGTNGGEFVNLLASPTLLATDFVIAA